MDGFQASGEEIERALLELGPLLGVSIKEEAPEEALVDAAVRSALSAPSANVNNAAENAAGCATPETGGSAGGGAAGADSLASPTSGRAPPSAARCVVCVAPLALAEGTPKLMECLHSICEACLKAKIEEKQSASRDFLGAERITIQCPTCRLQCQPANMIDQRFVMEKMCVDQSGAGSLTGEQQCSSCEETEPATSYCIDCSEFICDSCVLAHQRLKITKDHTIKGKEEAIAELSAAAGSRAPNEMYCAEHPAEKLSLFCETCDRLTCRDCQLQHHRTHKYQFSTEMAQQARASIAALLSEVNYKRVLLGSAMKVIQDRQQLIADKKKALVPEITQTVVKLTQAINTRGKQLVLRLNEVCDAKQRTLDEKKEALEQLAAITDHCVDFTAAALEHATDTALLHCKPVVAAHLQRIKSRRADIPNPEIPVRITLSFDKLPELVRVLSSIGAIVVDGKVDGGPGSSGAGAGPGSGAGASAQGPYHPPTHAQHSAVAALQQAAMHQESSQAPSAGAGAHGSPCGTPREGVANYAYGLLTSFVVGGGGGGGGGMGAAVPYLGPGMPNAGRGTRAHAHSHATPLRHALVSSTTHPHHLHGMSEMNLRGLLSAQAQAQAAAARSHHAQHPAMHAYHQMMGAYGGAASAGSGRRSGGPRTPSPAPAPPPAYHHQPAKWHIPQHHQPNGGFEMSMLSPGAGGAGADFKITLARQGAGAVPRAPAPSIVTSTNPKTPSPSLNGVGGVASLELDAVCAESVQDLMATIAKLDSNGVQVLPEQEPEPAPCHSSTDDSRGKLGANALAVSTGGAAAAASGGGAGGGDPNEDWCAVCMDGGELMCCDKCPKVFHQYCHIPTIEKLPDETETWQCLLCVNFAEVGVGGGAEAAPGGGLPPRLQKLVERITLELYCQYELSLAFREPVPPENLHYHSKISHPMCLDAIRAKLQPRAPGRYTRAAHFVQDCRLLFRNAYAYNPPDSQIYKDAKRLEQFFDAALLKWLPELAHWSGEGEPPPLPAKRPRRD